MIKDKLHNWNMKISHNLLNKKIILFFLLGWALPVIIMSMIITSYMDTKAREQIENTVFSSLNKAKDMLELEMKSCEVASKNISYYSDIREAYINYTLFNDELAFNNRVNGYLRSEYKYNSVAKSAVLTFLQSGTSFFTYNNSASANFKNISYYLKHVKFDMIVASQDLGTDMKLVNRDGRIYLVRNLMLQDFTPYAILSIEMNDNSLLKGLEGVWGYQAAAVFFDEEYAMGDESLTEADGVKDILKKLEKDDEVFVKSGGNSYCGIKFNRYGRSIAAVILLDNNVLYQKIYLSLVIIALLLTFMAPLVVIIYMYMKINKEELALRDAQIMALQSQINPHFLNNTFEIINWEARLNGNIKVSKMIEALSTMMEATMNRQGERFDSLAQELSYADAYAYIISERLGDMFTYEKVIDEELLHKKVPKLIIQPILENAVEHGLSKTRRGNVTLKLYRKEPYIAIEIINDGTLSQEDESRINAILNNEDNGGRARSLSLGIRNVNNRLKLIYGDDCGLFIESKNGEYTVSTILLKDVEVVEQQMAKSSKRNNFLQKHTGLR